MIALLLVLVTIGPARADARELSLADALTLAEQASPEVDASRDRLTAAERAADVQRSAWFPSLEWDEMDSSRLPEDDRNQGIGGLIGSPYRSGRLSAAVARGTLWDFGRTSNSVAAARGQARAESERIRLAAIDAKRETLDAYYDCARSRRQAEIWRSVHGEATVVEGEIAHFVKTGQRSVVDRLLAQAQADDADTQRAGYEARVEASTRRLAALTGLSDAACPELRKGDEPLSLPEGPNPLVARAEDQAESAHAAAAAAKANNYPSIVAAGTAGTLDAAGVKGGGLYAFAAGLRLPLFNGFGTTNDIKRAEAAEKAGRKDVDAAKRRVELANIGLDEAILSSKARLDRLEGERALAEDAYDVAKKRYFAFQGTVVDLREALRNLARTRSELADTRAEYLTAAGEKALLNAR
jgi:outer membrane protein